MGRNTLQDYLELFLIYLTYQQMLDSPNMIYIFHQSCHTHNDLVVQALVSEPDVSAHIPVPVRTILH